MAFPILGTPRPQFSDSTGVLASGTVQILKPVDDTNATYYPTADDADAGTNGQTGDITLNANGYAPDGLFGKNDDTFKIVVKDSAGNTIWTEDDIHMPGDPGRITYNQGGTGAHDRTQENKNQDVPHLFDFLTATEQADITNGTENNSYETELGQLITEFASDRNNIIQLPSGTIVLASTVTVSTDGLRLRGAGAESTILKASHTSGAVIKFQNFFNGIERVTIDATSARTSGGAATDFGIHHEAADTASATAKFGIYRDFVIKNQPGHGLALVNGFLGCEVANFRIHDNSGHGVIVDNGTLTSRTNTTRAGGVDMHSGVIQDNAGHSICVGADDSTTNIGYRIRVTNIDTFRNALSAGVRKSAYSAWMYTDSSTIEVSAFGGYAGPGEGTSTVGGIEIAGRNNNLWNNRYVGVTPAAISVNSISEAPTEGIDIQGVYVSGSNQSALDPAVIIASAATDVRVKTLNDTFITSLATGNRTRSEVELAGVKRYHGIVNASHFLSGDSRTIADDGVDTFEFDGVTSGTMLISGNVSGAGSATVHFRVGDNVFCNISTSTGPTVSGTTGALTGTTGTDAQLNLSAHTDNKIYIENRTGGERTYEVSFHAINGGRLLSTE